MSEVCLVLGGAGFIGSNIARVLAGNGYSVRVFDRASSLPGYLQMENIELVQGDFLQFSEWDALLKDVDYIFHNLSTTIPSTSDRDPIFDVQTNVLANIRILTEVAKHNVKKLVFSSSGGTIYGPRHISPIAETSPTDPITSYAISKLSVEKYLYYFHYHTGLDYVSLRYSNVYGRGQDPKGMVGAVTIFLESMARGESITVFGDGNIVRDYIYIDDVLQANLAVLRMKMADHVYNVGTGIGTSVSQLIASITEVTGLEANVRRVAARDSDVRYNVLDVSRLKNEAGWEPEVTLKEGISRLWKDRGGSPV
jgi:UDP-glucose 4-epimerase